MFKSQVLPKLFITTVLVSIRMREQEVFRFISMLSRDFNACPLIKLEARASENNKNRSKSVLFDFILHVTNPNNWQLIKCCVNYAPEKNKGIV